MSTHKRIWHSHRQNFEVLLKRSGLNGRTVKYKRIRLHAFTFVAVQVKNEYHIGVAHCHPNDNYCKKTGREIAEKNATNSPIHKVNVENLTFKEINILLSKELYALEIKYRQKEMKKTLGYFCNL